MERKYNVLLVDDSEIIVSKVKELLKKLSNIEFVSSTNRIADAKNIIKKQEIDIVVLDMRFPDGKGLDLLKWIKDYDPKISVIMFSNDSYQILKTMSWENGAEHFIDKSTEFEKLPAIISGFNKNKKQ